MPTALVTGVAGFIGSNLAAKLLDRGYVVRGLDNLETGRELNLDRFNDNSDFEFVEGDIRDRELLRDLTDGVDYLFHQAAVSSVPRSVEDPVSSTDINCTGTAAVLDAARHAGVDSVVVASSAAVYGSSEVLPKVETMAECPESPYALSKYYTEKLALQFSELYEINTIALRYFNIFGPYQNPNGDYAAVIPKFIDLMLDNTRPVIYGDGEQSRDFTYIDNAIQANILAAEEDATGEVINVACGERISIDELVSYINEELEADIEPRYEPSRPGDIPHSCADISKAKNVLGYEPDVGFREGLRRSIEHYKT